MKFTVLLLAVGLAVASAKNIQNLRLDRDHRIIGGVETDRHEFPSMLNIGYHYCGAALINEKWALTAAHCVPLGQVVGGDHLINTVEGTEVEIPVLRSIPHPSYGSPGRFSNDVALLELSSEFVLNDRINTIPLAPRGFAPTGNSVVVGWGTDEFGNLPNELKKVTVPLVSQEDCIESYGNDIDDSMICAGVVNYDSCQGDSGGPLFCDNNGQQVHCGVVSWGIGCGLDGYPGVYARTSYALDFIEETTGLRFN